MSALNLLPDSYAKERRRRRLNLLFVVLYGVVMASLIPTERVTRKRNANTRQALAGVLARYLDAGDFLNTFQALHASKCALLREAEAAIAMEEGVPRSYILGVIAMACPEALALDTVSIAVRMPTPRPISPSEKKTGQKSSAPRGAKEEAPAAPEPPLVISVALSGVAMSDRDVAHLLAALKAHPLMSRVDLRYTKEALIKNQPYRAFEIGLEIKGDAGVMDFPPLPGDPSGRSPSGGQRGGPAS